MSLSQAIHIVDWDIPSKREYDDHARYLTLLQGILTYKYSFKHIPASNCKQLLSNHNNMFGSNEQQDGSKAFNVISDVLDKATFVPLHFNNLYSSKIWDYF